MDTLAKHSKGHQRNAITMIMVLMITKAIWILRMISFRFHEVPSTNKIVNNTQSYKSG